MIGRCLAALTIVITLVTACRPPPGPSPGSGGLTPNVKAVEEFYRGKNIRLLVGFTAGGGFDVLARLVARHFSKHIPGNPTVVVENMPGANGLVANNYLFSAAPKDGTVLGVFSEPSLQAQLLKADGVLFDAREYNWLGSTQVQTQLCYARTDTGITSMEALLSSGRQLIVGTTGPGSNQHDFPAVLKGALGANLRLVPGYPGSSDIALALESGEVTANCRPWESVKATSPQWFSGDPPFATILLQQGVEKHRDLPNVPLAEVFARTPAERQLIRAASATLSISKPLAAPPGVPVDRVAVLRQAFLATMADPELLRDADAQKTDLSIKPADQVLAIINEVLSTPPDVAQQLKTILETT